jgi:hypothetical protein
MYTGTAASLYSRLESDRDSFLRRARDCSSLTLPMLIPPQGHSHATIFPTTFQGLGARGVNHLSASLLMSLLPPNQPFFRLVLDEEAVRAIGNASEYRTEIDQTLSSIERAVMQEIETIAMRSGLFEALKHLIVGGNALMYLSDDGLRVFHLDQYVIKRDPMGRLLHIVVKETVAPAALPDDAKAIVMSEYGEEFNSNSMDSTCDLYTIVCRKSEDKFDAWQEIKNIEIPGSRGSYNSSSLPWFALRMNRVDGESYGRGYVEEYLGDLKSLESLMQAIVEGSAAAAKVLFLVNPNGLTDPETLSRSPNGAIREGMATDVSVLQVQKQADFSIALQTIGAIRERLSYAFLLAESTIRNAERVTAEEVRLTTAAVERQLGGIYSILSQEFQLPLVARLMDVMQRKKKLPKVPKEFVKPVIITGIDALGRGNDLAKLDAFLTGIQQTFGPQAVGQYINISEYLSRRAASLGLDPKGLIKDEESMAADQNQAMQMQMMDKLGPAAVTQLGKGLSTGAFEMPGPAAGAQSLGQAMSPQAAAGMMGQLGQ